MQARKSGLSPIGFKQRSKKVQVEASSSVEDVSWISSTVVYEDLPNFDNGKWRSKKMREMRAGYGDVGPTKS